MIKTAKKTTPRPLLAILLAIMAVSCTREEFVPDSSSDSGDYLRFSFSAAPQTRVAMDEETGAGTFEEGDAIGLYSFIEWGYESDYFTLTQRGGEWTPRLTREELGGTGRTLHACYPASDRLQDKFNYPFEVAADQSSEETYRNSDLLWGSCPLPDGNTVDIAFRHMMFRLNVDFSRIEETVSDVKIRGKRGGVVQLTNGEFFPDREEEYGWIKAYQRKDGLWSVYMSPQTTQYANYYKEGGGTNLLHVTKSRRGKQGMHLYSGERLEQAGERQTGDRAPAAYRHLSRFRRARSAICRQENMGVRHLLPGI